MRDMTRYDPYVSICEDRWEALGSNMFFLLNLAQARGDGRSLGGGGGDEGPLPRSE